MTILRLLDLAKRDFRAGFFPDEHFYHHHPSFADLEACALQDRGGCPLCWLILDSFQGAQHDATSPTWPLRRSGPTGAAAAGPATRTTMREAARKLPKSDVRIALRARHVATGATIKFVRMFDILAIRLGDRLELGDPLRVPDLLLVLRVPNSGDNSPPLPPPVLDGFQIGCSEIDCNLGSAANLRLARSWLDGCRTAHGDDCGAAGEHQPPKLPMRVIDVLATPTSARIVQACDVNNGHSDHGRADYVALSHCWGGPIKTLLTTTTAAAFATALPPASALPANFRDAMTVTRALGIRYLWIDSLCIVQDSVDDWRRESRTMGDVYSRATVSLLAMAAGASDSGILLTGESKHGGKSEGVIVTFAFAEAGASASRPVLFKVSAIFQDDENLRLLSERAPLSQRGWTLQELKFSARILFYGKDQIYWHCRRGGYKSAEGLPDGTLYRDYQNLLLGTDLLSMADAEDQNADGSTNDASRQNSVEAILSEFYHFITAYTQRHLTFGSDKFPAVSSFAQQIHRTLERARHHDTSLETHEYLAGIWSGDFRRGLLFCPERMHCPHVTANDEKDYRAPSWSWAVTDAPITFLAPKTPLSKRPSPLNLALLSWSVMPRDPNNAFGAVDSAHLIVRGRVRRLIRSATHFVGAYTWDKKGEDGMAWFDDPPVLINAAGSSQPLDTSNGNCPVFFRPKSRGDAERNDGDGDSFLATYFCPASSTNNKTVISPDLNDCEDQRYTILLVDLGQEDAGERELGCISGDENSDGSVDEDEDGDWEFEERLIHCLILRQVVEPGNPGASVEKVDGVYERVGCLVLDWKNRRQVDNWHTQTLKLV
ncbi:Heterokaryon incompatibility [Niveomyces insectorum RCEF 264]|uniref:Heterokaryon incompatibility n=1 Tax=Niveomyces insectorum RCEF 264 TaxID=1081102 RepID=A0A167P634_9HYPO|nr:Heterokaryon incompatibility [Niveomyces insectorum RCEF 264]